MQDKKEQTTMPTFDEWAKTLMAMNISVEAVSNALEIAFYQGMVYGIRKAIAESKGEGSYKGVF